MKHFQLTCHIVVTHINHQPEVFRKLLWQILSHRFSWLWSSYFTASLLALDYLDLIVEALNTSNSKFKCFLVLVVDRFLFAWSQESGNHADCINILFFGHFHHKFEVLSGNYFELMLEVKLTEVVESDEYKTISRLFEAFKNDLILFWKKEIFTFLQELERFNIGWSYVTDNSFIVVSTFGIFNFITRIEWIEKVLLESYFI